MKRYLKVIPFLLLAILVAVPAYSQSASISGKVIGRDGQPAANIALRIDQLTTNNGRLQIRETLPAKTGRNGEYSLSGLYPGRVKVTVMENGQPVEGMVAGEKIGDEIFLADGLDKRIPTFDLTKAPAPVAAGAAGTASTSNLTAAERDALKKKLEAEAAAAGEVNKYFEAGKVAFVAKDYPESVKNFKLAAEKSPTPSDIIYANLGRAHDAAKEYEEAIGAYQKAIAIKATESNYYLNLSLAQIGAGKVEDSKGSIERAAALNPLNAGMAYYNLAATLINRRDTEAAVAPLKKSIELDPKYGNAYYQLGMISAQKGNLAEAAPFLEKYIALTPVPPAGDRTIGPCSQTVQECLATAKSLIDFAKSPQATVFSNPAPAATTPAPAGRGAQPAGARGQRGQ